MDRKYNLKLDLQFRCNNQTMKFNQFDNNTSDFFMRITNAGKLVDIEKAIVVLAVIKPSGKVSSQFVEVENGLVYADLKNSMKDEIGTYTAQAMLILEDERVVTDPINYEVEEDKIFSLLNDTVEYTEEYSLLTDMLNRLSIIEISEEQRQINEAERILSEENRKIEEVKRVEAELIRQHEEADRTKYDAIRESNENIRKQNESIRLSNETNRIDEEAKRVEEENKRKLAEEERNANYNFMTEDEERRRSEANAHKEAENLRVQAETNRVNEEAKRRTTEQARVSAENTRVSNENTREANEVTRKSNEAKRVEAETQRQNRYNSFISDAEDNANNFENYTNNAKVKEEERKANELDRKSQEAKRVSNEVERISNENTRKANEVVREENEASRQNTFENKVSEVDEKISEINTTKDNFISSINTKVDNKISEIEVAKSDMTNTVSNKVNEVENRFNALTSKQQQDAEVVDARDGEISLKARLDRDIEKANKELDKIRKLEESTVSTVETESDFTTVEATNNGYFEDVKLEGKTLVNLYKNEAKTYHADYIFSPNERVNLDLFIPGNTYTAIVHNSTTNFDTFRISSGDVTYDLVPLSKNTIVKFIYTPPTNDAVKNNIRCYCYSNVNKFVSGDENKISITILEGDHTQNPPSYFEGLKSVGQSATTSEDGVDEIVVSSVKNLLDYTKLINKVTNGSTGVIGDNNYRLTLPVNDRIEIYSQHISVKCTDTLVAVIAFNKKDGVPIYDSGYLPRNKVSNLSLPSETKYITINAKRIVDSSISKEDLKNVFIYHQSDKKRLLYYNEETQAWEKPILREWDSIEKHADGKYYYHQRSGEVVLNGSENWKLFVNSEVYILFSYEFKTYINSKRPKFYCDRFMCAVNDWLIIYNTEAIAMMDNQKGIRIGINKAKLSTQDVQGFKQWLQANNVTVVYQLAEEKVYECTNIDLITYSGETNYVVESGAIVPKTTLKVHNNISNVVSLLQKKVSLLESNITSYMITQNRLMLASRYNADTVSFKVDVATLRNSFEYDNDLYELILNNILVGKDNYNREYIENLIIFYWMDFVISDEMYCTLFEIIEEQHNPKVIEAPIE